MIIITAKEYLECVRLADIKINIKYKELHTLELKTTQISVQTIRERVQSSGSSDPMRIIDKIADMQAEIDAEIDKYIDLRNEARTMINQLADNRYRVVLTEYYLNNKTWEQVAEFMGYSLRWVYRLHDSALIDFSKILN